MRERVTVRVLLFNPAGHVLLMKGRFPHRLAGPGAWFTVGGGANPGEAVEACAVREVAEETGFTDVRLGPVVWTRQAVGYVSGDERVMFLETYIVAHCAGGEPSRGGWEVHEHDLVDDIRWWSLEEIASTTEMIFPERFAALLPDIVRGDYPDPPLDITVVKT